MVLVNLGGHVEFRVWWLQCIWNVDIMFQNWRPLATGFNSREVLGRYSVSVFCGIGISNLVSNVGFQGRGLILFGSRENNVDLLCWKSYVSTLVDLATRNRTCFEGWDLMHCAVFVDTMLCVAFNYVSQLGSVFVFHVIQFPIMSVKELWRVVGLWC